MRDDGWSIGFPREEWWRAYSLWEGEWCYEVDLLHGVVSAVVPMAVEDVKIWKWAKHLIERAKDERRYNEQANDC